MKIGQIHVIIDELPSKVQSCESLCRNAEEVAFSIKRDMDLVNQKCIGLETKKTDLSVFN